MSDLQDLDANYCPVCGNIVEVAQATAADTAFEGRAQGSYEASGKHVVLDGSQVRVYVHGDQNGEPEVMTDGGETVELVVVGDGEWHGDSGGDGL